MLASIIITGIVALSFAYVCSLKVLKFNIFTFFGFIIVSVLLCMATFSLSQTMATRDYEVWNGQISDKEAPQRNCQRGWSSFQDDFCTEYETKEVSDPPICSTDSKGNSTCTYPSHTEYKYIFPWEKRYFVFAKNLKDSSWEIDRIDRQGVNTPPKYTSVNVGDPASIENAYTNWVKAASDSLFHDDVYAESYYKDDIPRYPNVFYDDFKIDRVISVGVNDLDLKSFSNQLSIQLRDLGPKKQMNAIIILADAKKADTKLSYVIRKAWQGFKKNDAVIFIGLDDHKIAWANVMSWSKESLFDVQMRDAILDLKNQDINMAMPKILDNLHFIGMVSYQRREMKEFEYLANEIPIPIYYYIIAFILSAMAAFGMIFVNEKFQL